MTTSTQLVIIFIIGISAIGALGAFLYYNASVEQRVEIQSRLFVQLVGTVLLGAIVTYSLYIIEHSREAVENKKRVLALIKQELLFDMNGLKSRDGPFDASNRLKSEFWKISGLSGDLRWIDSPDLLNSISQAYFDVDIAADWERRALDTMTGPALTLTLTLGDGSHKSVLEFLDPFVRRSYKTASASVSEALDKLKDY